MSGVGSGNPVIPGFHPDPSVCRVEDAFYLVTSTFTYFPGVPIFRSTNLVDWTQIGNVLDRPTQLDLGATQRWTSAGIYAPTIRHHDGRFWMITTLFGDSLRNFVVTADDPAGPWSEPMPVAVNGIDPDLAWDDAGNCWVHTSMFDHVARWRIDDRTGERLDGPHQAWAGTGLHAPEAPHLYQIDGSWYLMIAEGGTERGHGVSIARGPSPGGPWESCPANPFLSHRSTGRPVQNTGHADLVEAPDGSWWMVLLGVRPRGVSPGFHTLGRETFLAAVDWVDGWPAVGEVLLELDRRPPGTGVASPVSGRDDFDGATLDPRWVAVRRPPGDFTSLTARPGWLTIDGEASGLDSPFPSFLARRQQHHFCRVRVLVDAGDAPEAGLAVYHDDASHYEVAVCGDRVVARARVGTLGVVVGEAPCPDGPVELWLGTAPHVHGPDTVRLGFVDRDGEVKVLAELDGRYLSTEVTGGFVGRTIGIYAVGGTAAFDWFDYEPGGATISQG